MDSTMTGRFLNVGGVATDLGGGGGSTAELLVAFDVDAAAWMWASGELAQVEIASWNSPGSAIGVALAAGGLSLTGNTATVVVESGAADKAFALASTGVAPMLFPRWVDSNNFVAWNPQVSGSTGRLRVRTAGANTDETAAGLYSAATNWGVEVVGNTVNLYGDGALVATRTVTAHASTTKAAFGHQGTSGTVTLGRVQNGTVALL
jgi:hypothetical protein